MKFLWWSDKRVVGRSIVKKSCWDVSGWSVWRSVSTILSSEAIYSSGCGVGCSGSWASSF